MIELINLRGMIANCAIENSEHDKALEKIDILIDKYGPLHRVDPDEAIQTIYRGKDDD